MATQTLGAVRRRSRAAAQILTLEVPRAPYHNEKIIETLRRLLAQAYSGEITDLAYVALGDDGRTSGELSGNRFARDPHKAVGALMAGILNIAQGHEHV